MRILFVGFGSSIHSARWISQFEDQNWDLHLFPVDPYHLNSSLRNVTVHYLFPNSGAGIDPSVRQSTLFWPFRRGRERLKGLSARLPGDPLSSVSRLSRLIGSIKPDLVHSFDSAGGLLTYDAYCLSSQGFPRWIHSSWGSDLYSFGREEVRKQKTRGMMTACRYFMADCQRELELAPEYGFTGEILGVFSAGGGYDIENMQQYRKAEPPSQRRIIALKGRHGVLGGRGLDALRAIELCRHLLMDYQIRVFLPQGDISGAIEYVRRWTGLDITVIPEHSSHAEILSLFGSARIAIALGMTDGTPHSMLEAMTMGAFPIQSNTADTRGWIEDGRNGFVVPPEDPQTVAEKLKLSLVDDQLVDYAADINLDLLRSRKEIGKVKPEIISIYRRLTGLSN